MTSRPALMDPLDHRNVYVAESGIEASGEGLFARRDILQPKISLFNPERCELTISHSFGSIFYFFKVFS